MSKLCTRISILLLFFSLVPVFAATVKELSWDDLRPVIEYDDPFEKLTQDQLYYLGTIARAQQFQQNGWDLTGLQ